MNQDLDQALSYDALSDAEKITGVSYKEEPLVSLLGMSLMLQHNEKKDALLFLNRDTSHKNTLQQQVAVFEDMGFKPVLCEPIPDTNDKWRVFWRPGVLLFCDSYWDDSILNSGTAYFNYRGPASLLSGCSYSRHSEDDGVPVYNASLDVREGFRHRMDSMAEKGVFLPKWTKAPFLWLLHYNDTKVAGYDYHAINAERIAMLPKDIREAIQ